jgi:hypothetical protein
MASSIKGITDESLDEVTAMVSTVLLTADSLSVEVVSTALLYLKENPEVTIEQALSVGLSDWDV